MKLSKALFIVSLTLIYGNLFSIPAAELLKDPGFSARLDSLKFQPHIGFMDISVPGRKYPITEKHIPSRIPQQVSITFTAEDSTPKEIIVPFILEQGVYYIVNNGKYCMVRVEGRWDLYTIHGKFICTYKDLGWQYVLIEVTDTGNAIFLKEKHGNMLENSYNGMVMINTQNKIIYYDEHYNSEVEVAISKDGKYTAVLEKAPDKTDPIWKANPESYLSIYNDKFQRIYGHKFPRYINHYSNQVSSGVRESQLTMVFIDHSLFLADRQEHVKKDANSVEAIWDGLYFMTVDVATGTMYWRKKDNDQIHTAGKQIWEQNKTYALSPIHAEAILMEPGFSSLLDSLKFKDYPPRFEPKVQSGYFRRYDELNSPSLGKMTISKNAMGRFVYPDSIDGNRLYVLPNKNVFIFKIRGNWDMYDISGKYLRSYSNLDDKYYPLQYADPGYVIFYARDNTSRRDLQDIKIVNNHDRIVYSPIKDLFRLEITFSQDGKYCAILEKETGQEKGLETINHYQFKHASRLTIYNEQFHQVYRHDFPVFLNQGYEQSNLCMAFVNHTLLLFVATSFSKVDGRFGLDINGFKHVSVDAETGQAYQREVASKRISALSEP